MILLHNIGDRSRGSNYNTIDEILGCQEQLSFDGIYLNVYPYARQLGPRKPILFIMGKYEGQSNEFDTGMPLEYYCSWKHLLEMEELGFELSYHSWSHRDLTKIPENELIQEIMPPFQMDKFAYPYGAFNEKVIEIVKQCGYKEAFSVFQGDGTQYQQNRQFLNW